MRFYQYLKRCSTAAVSLLLAAPNIGCGVSNVETTEASVMQPIVVNGERTNARPVGAHFAGQKFLSWMGTDRRINFLRSTSTNVWGSKQTIQERVKDGAGIALAEFNGRLFLAWTGLDGRINLLSTSNGVSWGQKITFPDRSDRGPALAAHDGKLYIVHRGNDSHLYLRSSLSGANFSAPLNLQERSNYGPSITSLSGHLFVGWTGTDRRLNIMELDSRSLVKRDKVVLSETSEDGTWIAGFGDELMVSWRGSGNRRLNFAHVPECVLINILASGTNSVSRFKTTLTDTSHLGPTVADYNGDVALFWRGTDTKVNVRERIAVAQTTDPDPTGSGHCVSSGGGHSVPTTLSAADSERRDRTYRLLRAWLLSYNVRAGDFGTWPDAGTIGFRRITAGLMTQKVLEETDGVASPSPDLAALRQLRPPSNFSQLVENWLVANSHIHRTIGTHGDFDFHLTAAMTLLNAFGTATRANGTPFLTPISVRRLLVYSDTPTSCDSNANIDACGRRVPFAGNIVRKLSHKEDLPWPFSELTVPETENHVLMINAWAYLANQWVRTNPRNDSYLAAFNAANPSAFVNRGSHLEQGLLSIISRFVKNGYFETNARPYQGYTVRALMQLAMFAESERVRTAARNAVDYTAARVAFSSFQGQRYAPMRRQWNNRNKFGLYVSDYATVMFSFLAGAYAFDDDPTCHLHNCLWTAGGNQYRGFALEALVSGYEIPRSIQHFMLRYDNERPGFGAYTTAQARYSPNMYRIHQPAHYPAPNVMNDPDLDGLARAQAGPGTDNSYELAMEHYFTTLSFFNSSGATYNNFDVAGLGGFESLAAGWFADDILKSQGFLAKPSSVILAGNTVAWRSAAEAESATAMMRGSIGCSDGVGYCSKNGPAYKNVTFGYDERSGFPVQTPPGWSQSATMPLNGDAQARVLTPPRGGAHVLVVDVGGLSGGLWEVLPSSLSVSHILTTAQQRNSNLARGGLFSMSYRTVCSNELLAFSVIPGLGATLDQVDGVAATDVSPKTYQDVVRAPLLRVRQVDQNCQFTGVDYVHATGDGLVRITNPHIGETLILDSRDHQNPVRIRSTRPLIASFRPELFVVERGEVGPGPTVGSLVVKPGADGIAQFHSEFEREGSDWVPGSFIFEVAVAGEAPPNGRLRVMLNGPTGTVQLGASARLNDLAGGHKTKLQFNVPADTHAALQESSEPVTLAIEIDDAEGTAVELSSLRSTNYRSHADGQGAIGRWDDLWQTDAPTEPSPNATAGQTSQMVCGGHVQTLMSPVFNPFDFTWVSRRLAVDVYVPSTLAHSEWQGSLHLSYAQTAELPEPQIVAQADISGLSAGEWVTVTFELPEEVFQLLQQDTSGSSFHFTVEAEVEDSDCFRFDNIRFLGELHLNAPPVNEDGGPKSLSTVERVFAFESAHVWHAIHGAQPVVRGSAGGESAALSIHVDGWTLIESSLFLTSELPSSGSTLSFEVSTPEPMDADAEWSGEISVFVECPTQELWNELAGQVPLPAGGATETVSFELPSHVAEALASDDNECRLQVAFNAPANAAPFVMDNMRIEP